MRAALCQIRVLLLGVLLAACATSDNLEPPAPLESFSASARVVGVWTARLSSQVNLSAYTLIPHASDELVYVLDNKGMLVALARETGSTRWHRHVDSNVSAGISADNENLYLGTLQGELIALNKTNGAERWRAKMTTEIVALPSAGGGLVAARSIDGRVSLFSALDGSEQWSYSRNVPALTIRGNSPPLLSPDGVLVGLDSGKLVALNIEEGKPYWEVTLSESAGRSEIERLSDIDANLIFNDGQIYAAGFQGKLAQINPRGGRINWARDLSTVAGFRIRGDAIFVTDVDSVVWALDKRTGTSIWKQDKMRARQLTAPTPVGDYLMVADLDGYVHWLSQADGQLVARKRVADSRIITAPAFSNDTVFVQSQYGLVSALQITRD